MRFFCPRCWDDFAEDLECCPRCGLNLREYWGSLSYPEKLMVSLRHPEPTTPERCALLLGQRKERRAVAPLIELVERTRDTRDMQAVFVAQAAIAALGRIGTAAARRCLAGLRLHPNPMIRKAALAASVGLRTMTMRHDSRKELMMNSNIASVRALEILDSRGNPTLRVSVTLDNGITAAACVPSGASTGENEAVELRDGDKKRYGGKGVLKAVANVNDLIAPKIVGMAPNRQAQIDRLMIELDGTPNKGKLGANAILGVSMAVARAAAMAADLPLYAYLGGTGAVRIPVPMMNILNGGKHADNSVDFQEFMCMPVGAPTFAEALRYGAETFHALKSILHKKGYATSVGDEGGFAPNLKSNDEACEVIVEAIQAAGYKPGKDVAIALDPAASSFFEDGAYQLSKSGQGRKNSAEMTALYKGWVEKYPIVSIEDGLAENDWAGFKQHTAALGSRIQIVGDDLYVTNTKFIERGIKEQSTNAVLIKLNQIGTVTETIEAIDMCRKAGWGFVVSHRSGETEDAFMADFAVAMGGGQIKTGSACRSERIAKYNRLLEIEAELGKAAVFGNPFAGKA